MTKREFKEFARARGYNVAYSGKKRKHYLHKIEVFEMTSSKLHGLINMK